MLLERVKDTAELVTISTYGSSGFDGREIKTGVSPCDPGGAAEEGDPVPSAQAHPPDDAADHRAAAAAPDEERPILLDEVDDALRESAGIGGAQSPLLLAWRESLTRILETLTYARSVLADDVGILRHRLVTDAPSSKEVVDDLPGVLTAGSWGADWSVPDDRSAGMELDAGVFARSDALLAAHTEMASVDLASAEDVRRVLGVLDEQLAALTARYVAVEARLDEIRAAVERPHEDRGIPTSDGPG